MRDMTGDSSAESQNGNAARRLGPTTVSRFETGIEFAAVWCNGILAAIWKNRVLLSLPAKLPSCAWTDRWVFKHIGLGPRLLSSTLPSARQLDRASGRRRLSMTEAFFAAVWRHHSIANAVVMAFVVLTVLLAFAVALARFTPGELSSHEVDIALGTLGTLAEATGATVGILLAVVTFGVTLRAQNEQDTWSLLPFVARRYGMFLIVGAAVGVAAADAVMPALYPWVDGKAVRWMVRVNVIAFPITLVASLWLVCKVIQDAGVSTLSNTLPVIQAAMRDSALNDERNSLRFHSYQEHLKGCGLQYDGLAWYSSGVLEQGRRVELHLSPGGVVTDVDLIRLRHLGHIIASIDGPLICKLTIAPGDTLSDHATLVLTRENPGSAGSGPGQTSSPNTPELTLSISTERVLRRLLRSVFVIRGR